MLKRTIPVSIYTIPYPSHIYQLKQTDIRHCDNLINNNIDTFINVTNLNFQPTELMATCQYHFPNVTSLAISRYDSATSLTAEHVEYLKKIVNLSNLKHLRISVIAQTESSLILDLLKEASQLSAITIDSQSLRLCLKNDQICQYFSRMIRRLYQADESLVWYDVNISRFCEIFFNIEHLQCNIDAEDHLLILLYHLPKLSTMEVACGGNDDPKKEFYLLEKEVQKSDMICNWRDHSNGYFYKYGLRIAYVKNKLFIWMNKKVSSC